MYVQEIVCAGMSRRVHVRAGECVCAHELESTCICRRVCVCAHVDKFPKIGPVALTSCWLLTFFFKNMQKRESLAQYAQFVYYYFLLEIRAIGLILANHPFQKVKWGVHLLHLRESPSELRRYASCTAKRKARLEDAAANVSLYAYSSFSEVLALAVSEVPT